MLSSHLKKIAIVFIILCIVVPQASAHVIIKEMENMSAADAGWLYLKLGFQHILPWGLDHILFIISLFLLHPKLKPVIWQSTAFTIAHSITLGLAMYGVVAPPSEIVEPLIALSIVFVAFQNIFSTKQSDKVGLGRMGIVFLFGLVHGLGFAGSLSEMGMPQQSFLSSLIMFNVGVELGQLAVILFAFLFIGKWFGAKPFYRRVVVIPVSAMIILIAGYWTVERILF